MPKSTVLIYLLRRDLRVSDNPILHHLSTKKDHGFTHLLPVYVFAAQQVEVKGFLKDDSVKSPYREARSQVGGFWRCGPHRAKFLAESVWDLKTGLEKLGSDLCIRVGMVPEVISLLVDKINQSEDMRVGSVWMFGEEGVEEGQEERAVKNVCRNWGAEFKLWPDEKYLIDDRDLPLSNIAELSDVFTTYRKTVEPLRDHPRPVLPTPSKNTLPAYVPKDILPAQAGPFAIPDSLDSLRDALLSPVKVELVKNPPKFPKDAQSSHPYLGGETRARIRLEHLVLTGNISTYQDTRNGLMGLDFSTKLSAYLVLGCITARQIHASLLEYEDGTNENWRDVEGYSKGENVGTRAIRFELLWRDYMRLCTRKFGPKLFRVSGFKGEYEDTWISPSHPGPDMTTDQVRKIIDRFLSGTTGMGLIDASMRELYHTGYTSNRARQNVASFFAKHLRIDWRIGAEWYECMLVDYDLSSNWGNWQYLAGVGNDPRGEARIFNPVKQAFDYDPNGEYVKAWVEELRTLSDPSEIFQAWTTKETGREGVGLKGLQWVEEPLLRIDFHIARRGRHLGRSGGRGGDRGGRGGGNEGNYSGRGRGGTVPYGGRGYGSSRGHIRGYGTNRGGGGGGGGGGGNRGGYGRMGVMERDAYYSGGGEGAGWGQ